MPTMKPARPVFQPGLAICEKLEHLYLFDDSRSQIGNSTIRDLVGVDHVDWGNITTFFGQDAPGMWWQAFTNLVKQSVAKTIPPPFTIMNVFLEINGNALYSHDTNGNNDGYRVATDGGGNYKLTFGSVADYASIATTLGAWNIAISSCTGNGGTNTNWVMPFNGGPIVTNTHAVGTISGTPNAIGIGGRGAFGVMVGHWRYALTAHWSRALSQGEAYSLFVDPWQMVTPIEDEDAYEAAGVGGGGGGGSVPIFVHHMRQQGVA